MTRHRAGKHIIAVLTALLIVLCAFSSVSAKTNTETFVKPVHTSDGGVRVLTFSTEKQAGGKVYSLYVVKKEKDKWVKDTYLRDIVLPAADKSFKGKKYKYISSDLETVEWMRKNTIYRLYPKEEKTKDHPSVPFWKNPLT